MAAGRGRTIMVMNPPTVGRALITHNHTVLMIFEPTISTRRPLRGSRPISQHFQIPLNAPAMRTPIPGNAPMNRRYSSHHAPYEAHEMRTGTLDGDLCPRSRPMSQQFQIPLSGPAMGTRDFETKPIHHHRAPSNNAYDIQMDDFNETSRRESRPMPQHTHEIRMPESDQGLPNRRPYDAGLTRSDSFEGDLCRESHPSPQQVRDLKPPGSLMGPTIRHYTLLVPERPVLSVNALAADHMVLTQRKRMLLTRIPVVDPTLCHNILVGKQQVSTMGSPVGPTLRQKKLTE